MNSKNLSEIDRDIFQLEEIVRRCEERILHRRERKQMLWNVAFESDDYEKFSRFIREAEQLTAHDEHEIGILHAAQERISALRDHLQMMIQLQNAEAASTWKKE